MACCPRSPYLWRAKLDRSPRLKALLAPIGSREGTIDDEARVLLNARLPSGRRVVSWALCTMRLAVRQRFFQPPPCSLGGRAPSRKLPSHPRSGNLPRRWPRLGRTPRERFAARGALLCRRWCARAGRARARWQRVGRGARAGRCARNCQHTDFFPQRKSVCKWAIAAAPISAFVVRRHTDFRLT